MSESSTPSTPIEQLEGSKLQRAFLMAMHDYEQFKHTNLRPPAQVMNLSDKEAERLSYSIITMAYNLERMADMLSLEFGIPIL